MKPQEASIGRVRGIADVTRKIMNGKGAELKVNPGKGQTVLDYGIHRLHERAAFAGVPMAGMDAITERAYAEFDTGNRLCESPIERAMLGALITGPWSGFDTIPAKVHDPKDIDCLPAGDIVIVPQMAFVRFRFDFGIVLRHGKHMQLAAVECDGEAFHGDANKERFRVAYLTSWGVPVFKFTGARIHDDAIACADEVALWASKWMVTVNV